MALWGCAAGVALAQTAPMPAESDSRWSLSVEALFASLKASPTPVPIVTDNYLDVPGVNVLLGGGTVDTNVNAGLRVTGTYRIDNRMGIEVGGFYLPSRTTSASVSSTGQPGSVDLLLPFYDVTIHQENVTELSFWPTTAAARRRRSRIRSAGARSTSRGRCRRTMAGASICWAASASCSCASRTPSPPAARTTRRIRRTSGTPPTHSTLATASTACRWVHAPRSSAGRG